MRSPLSALALALAAVPTAISPVAANSFEECLRPQLSGSATLVTAQSNVTAPRWTEYKEFVTGHVVNASTEADVQAAVRNPLPPASNLGSLMHLPCRFVVLTKPG